MFDEIFEPIYCRFGEYLNWQNASIVALIVIFIIITVVISLNVVFNINKPLAIITQARALVNKKSRQVSLRPSEAVDEHQFLFSGETLSNGQSIISENGRFAFTQKATGGLCYSRDGIDIKCVDRAGLAYTVMQDDGNLCQYQGTPNNPGKLLWQSQTAKPRGEGIPAVLLSNDGTISVGVYITNEMINQIYSTTSPQEQKHPWFSFLLSKFISLNDVFI